MSETIFLILKEFGRIKIDFQHVADRDRFDPMSPGLFFFFGDQMFTKKIDNNLNQEKTNKKSRKSSDKKELIKLRQTTSFQCKK